MFSTNSGRGFLPAIMTATLLCPPGPAFPLPPGRMKKMANTLAATSMSMTHDHSRRRTMYWNIGSVNHPQGA